jgi:hypothetical protein
MTMRSSNHDVLSDAANVTSRTGSLRRLVENYKRFIEAMDYSATDHTFDRVKALESRVSCLENARLDNGATLSGSSEPFQAGAGKSASE